MVVHSLALFGTLGLEKKIVRWHPPIIIPDATAPVRYRVVLTPRWTMIRLSISGGSQPSPIIVYDVNVPGHVRDLVDSWLRSADPLKVINRRVMGSNAKTMLLQSRNA